MLPKTARTIQVQVFQTQPQGSFQLTHMTDIRTLPNLRCAVCEGCMKAFRPRISLYTQRG